MRHLEVAVIGAGIGGICVGVQLKTQLGLKSFTIFEKDHEVGGTWLVNSYPGCACDVPSHVYSFSFAKNPNWSMKFSPAKEIHEYLIGVTDKYDLRKHIQFNTEVQSAWWDQAKQSWKLKISKNGVTREHVADVLIIGAGGLRIPNIPEKLVSEFEGEWAHSAQWKHDIDISDKSVAVIGSGASAVQIVPSIAPDVKQLYVFQRTPTWITPKDDFYYGGVWRWCFNNVPTFSTLYRWYLFLRSEMSHLAFRRGGMFSPLIKKVIQFAFEYNMNKQLPTETLRKALKPAYEVGCKRIVRSDDYFATFSLPNVELVTEPISKVAGDTIYSGDGTQTKVDTIILATGFKPELFLAPMRMVGKGGVDIADLWDKQPPTAFYGICSHLFPNAFIITGPNSGLGHNSIIFIIECQVNAIVSLLREMINNDISSLEVKQTVQEKYNKQIQEKLKYTVWASGCKSWYYSEEKGNFSLWPDSCVEFWKQTRQISIDNFDVVKMPRK